MVDEENKDPALDGDDDDQDGQNNEDDQYPNTDAKLRDQVRSTFQIFDKENQGFIDMDGLGTLLRWLNFNPTETEMDEYRNHFDAGQKNQISID